MKKFWIFKVCLDETEGQAVNVSNYDIEIIARDVDETTKDLSSGKDESDIAIVDIDVEEVPEPRVELVADENNNLEVEENGAGKVDSIRDLVNLWATEEKSLNLQEAGTGKSRTKKRRSELKPYLTSRGL